MKALPITWHLCWAIDAHHPVAGYEPGSTNINHYAPLSTRLYYSVIMIWQWHIIMIMVIPLSTIILSSTVIVLSCLIVSTMLPCLIKLDIGNNNASMRFPHCLDVLSVNVLLMMDLSSVASKCECTPHSNTSTPPDQFLITITWLFTNNF